MPVRVRIKPAHGPPEAAVVKVVFFIDRGKRRRVDRRKPYKTRIRVTFKRGSKHRVHARIYFRRKGSKTRPPQDGVQALHHVQVALPAGAPR